MKTKSVVCYVILPNASHIIRVVVVLRIIISFRRETLLQFILKNLLLVLSIEQKSKLTSGELLSSKLLCTGAGIIRSIVIRAICPGMDDQMKVEKC